jgi:anti-anti-sigma factor
MTETTLRVEPHGDTAVVRIGGDVTAASDGAFTEAYGAASQAGARAIVLDFSGMDYMNSGGIGLLVTMLVRAQRGGQRLFATGLSEHYRQILALTRLDEAIQVHPTEEAALAAV